MGVLIDLMCLLSKKMIIPDFLNSNLTNEMSIINVMELFCISVIIIALTFQFSVELFLDVYHAFCTNK